MLELISDISRRMYALVQFYNPTFDETTSQEIDQHALAVWSTVLELVASTRFDVIRKYLSRQANISKFLSN